jgi:Spy/CpxP family protein refolding chaperone
MRITTVALFLTGVLLVTACSEAQQSPPGKGDKGGKGFGKGDKKGGAGGGPGGGGKSATVEEMVARMMTFDKNGDGKLSKDEVTDERLQSLFDRADANKDGVVTKEELTALFTKESAAGGGPGGPGGGPGGPGGGRGGMQPGRVLPAFAADALNLTADQRKQVDDLQKEVDGRLEKILTPEQRRQFQELRDRGPGGPPPKRP